MESYIEGLSDFSTEAVVEACRRWPTYLDKGRWWPALAELRDCVLDVLAEHRSRQQRLTGPDAGKPQTNSATAIPEQIVNIRKTITEIQANPAGYVNPAALIGIGEGTIKRLSATLENANDPTTSDDSAVRHLSAAVG